MSVDYERVKKLGKEYENKIINYRHHLHQYPELSFMEFETNRWIHEKLENLDVTFNTSITGNSIVAIFDGGSPGPYIGFRADMDALPIKEANDLPFASCNDGVMHACGHDAHTAILLTFAEALANHPELVQGKVAFIFQQGEEKLPGGAQQIIAEGGLEGLDCVYALHVRTNMDIGEYDAESGARSCAAASYEVNITGTGGHTGFPQKACDPVSAAAAAIQEIGCLVGQKCSPKDTATISTSYIHSNNQNTPNVFAQSVQFGGTIRSLNNELMAQLPCWIRERVEAICIARGCTCTFDFTPGYAAVINHPPYCEYIDEVGAALGYRNVLMDDVMGAEDFSYMLLDKPGAYFTVGFRNPSDQRTGGDRHTPNLMLDEHGLRIAFELLMGTYLKTAEELQK